jgi:hypothetical protein
MSCEVEFTDAFEEWWDTLSEAEQDDIAAIVKVLAEKGASLPYPYSSGIEGSRHSHMRELRIQHAGNPYRVLYAFDPRRIAILLIGGSKTGDDRWYDKCIPAADDLYDKHLKALRKERLIK